MKPGSPPIRSMADSACSSRARLGFEHTVTFAIDDDPAAIAGEGQGDVGGVRGRRGLEDWAAFPR